jgi:polyhydroxyalkanoate synthesis regulator phasin
VPDKDLSEALRQAVERTYTATAGSAADTRERAGELLDEVTRRGSSALDEVRDRGGEARDAMGDVVSSLRREVESLRRRLAELEAKAKPKG